MNLDQGNDGESNLRAPGKQRIESARRNLKRIYIHVLHLIIVDTLGHDIVIWGNLEYNKPHLAHVPFLWSACLNTVASDQKFWSPLNQPRTA